jgi:ribosomal-protein-alanine N-acetyltransferase
MSSPEFSPREVSPNDPDDLAQLVRIESAVHIAPWSEAGFKGELEKPYSHTLVMTDEETDSIIGGYVVFWEMGEEIQILNVAVDLPYRGLGLAQKLIRKVIDLGLKKGTKTVVLDVRKSNNAAIQLYQKLGFTIQTVRKAFYSNSEDAYGMVLDLTIEKALDF